MVSFNHSHRDREIDPKLAWALEHREQFREVRDLIAAKVKSLVAGNRE